MIGSPAPLQPWTVGRIAEFLARTFIHPDQVVELRALNVGGPRRTVAGWFDGRHLLDLARTALAVSRQATGVYFTPNPVDPILLARCANKTDAVSRDRWHPTTDADILERRYLFVDLDPDRADGDNGQPASDDELLTALDAADVTADELTYHGWAKPLRMRSGNGVHLLFPLAVPLPPKVPEYEADPLRDFLDLCREWHFRGVVRADPNTHNAVRMLKVPGTRAVKGAESPGRPYRTADVLEIPDDWPAPRQPPERRNHDRSGGRAEPHAVTPGDQPGTPPDAGSRRPPAEAPRPESPGATRRKSGGTGGRYRRRAEPGRGLFD